ncbi:DHH family phosphoesterase [Oceanirhabdus seepicola]|uniref:Bifunctional oligoribonuclease/PAP phosphatase NrnA n=1 Tax=Oceanirhabdus seepicola TaxID=2828781 RepID=A0A9J6P6K1_9CLOT|nr:bifunctional oligoribonuclease/PAP phosphatase NrnA [Oceanirhabdus seepicola]MCM1991120.1 bifunctional oligoribonuclease/PAP phosphatase NrnA [Oceanirhabdus seepicola]
MDTNLIKDLILNADKVVITAHTSLDGDSLGSSLGLYGCLKKIKNEVQVVFKERPPKEFSFLPYYSSIKVTEEDIIEENDILIVLDCGNVERINLNINIDKFRNNIINIDHHKSNEEYGNINWVDSGRSAAGELVFELAKSLEIELDENISKCLYTALLTDTGSFKYSNTSKRTHQIAGELISKGINFTEIHDKIYENKSFKQIKLYATAIESMEMYYNNKLCIMEIKQSDIEKLEAENEDIGDLINLGTKIDTVEAVMLIKSNCEYQKVSLRSKKYIDVCKMAGLFDGGGHVRAAGFKSELSTDEIKEKIINYLKGLI